jgi:CheY-like chemotaxis protein
VGSQPNEPVSPAPKGLEAEAVMPLLHAIIAVAQAPAFVKDTAGRYLIANEAFAHLLGCPNVDVLIGRCADELLAAPTSTEIQGNDQTVIDAGIVLPVELKINGRTFLYRKAAWRDADGHVIGIVGIGRDPEGSHSALLLELEAASGADALLILDRDIEDIEIDLLFSDVVMPGGINGRQLADEALRRRPKLKVLFTTGYTRNAIVHHGRLDPDTHLISKPFSFQELAAKLRSRLDSTD